MEELKTRAKNQALWDSIIYLFPFGRCTTICYITQCYFLISAFQIRFDQCLEFSIIAINSNLSSNIL